MCWAFSKALGAALCLAVLAPVAAAESGVVSAIGSGRDSAEATVALLRSVVGKSFADEPASLVKSILQSEILPNASSFVQSYRIVEGGGRSASVSISADVDLDVIRALLSLTPNKLGAEVGAKALVVVRGARLPEGTETMKGQPVAADPYSILATAAKERFQRRQFEPVSLSPEALAAIPAGEDVASPELLRGLGAEAGARLVMGISSRYEAFENENSHNKEQRIVINAALIDVKSSGVLGRASVTVNEPRNRKDYVAELQRSLGGDNGRDLLQDVLVLAGRKFFKTQEREDISILRVKAPANAVLVARFRSLLEGAKGVKSVTEHSIRRGAFDFALRPARKGAALVKMVQALPADDIAITILDPVAESDGDSLALVVRLEPKSVDPTTADVNNAEVSDEAQ